MGLRIPRVAQAGADDADNMLVAVTSSDKELIWLPVR